MAEGIEGVKRWKRIIHTYIENEWEKWYNSFAIRKGEEKKEFFPEEIFLYSLAIFISGPQNNKVYKMNNV